MSCGWRSAPSRGLASAWLGWLLLSLSLACGQQVELAAVTLGGRGESCETAEDCEAQLKCVDLVCQNGPAKATIDAGTVLLPSGAGQGAPVNAVATASWASRVCASSASRRQEI